MWPFKKKTEPLPKPKRDWVYEKLVHHSFPLNASEIAKWDQSRYAEYGYRYDLISGERQLLIYTPMNGDSFWCGSPLYNLGELGKAIDWGLITEYEINTLAEGRSIDTKLAKIENEERSAKIAVLKAAWAELDEK